MHQGQMKAVLHLSRTTCSYFETLGCVSLIHPQHLRRRIYISRENASAGSKLDYSTVSLQIARSGAIILTYFAKYMQTINQLAQCSRLAQGSEAHQYWVSPYSSTHLSSLTYIQCITFHQWIILHHPALSRGPIISQIVNLPIIWCPPLDIPPHSFTYIHSPKLHWPL